MSVNDCYRTGNPRFTQGLLPLLFQFFFVKNYVKQHIIYYNLTLFIEKSFLRSLIYSFLFLFTHSFLFSSTFSFFLNLNNYFFMSFASSFNEIVLCGLLIFISVSHVFAVVVFSRSRFFRVPEFLGSRFFRFLVFLGPDILGSGFRVRVQVLEVAIKI